MPYKRFQNDELIEDKLVAAVMQGLQHLPGTTIRCPHASRGTFATLVAISRPKVRYAVVPTMFIKNITIPVAVAFL